MGKYDIRLSNRYLLFSLPWNISCVGSNKVLPIGGWTAVLDDEGRLVLPARIVFNISQAGPGEQMCSVDG